MKKLLYILSVLTVVLLMGSCSKEEILPSCEECVQSDDTRIVGNDDNPDGGGIIDPDKGDGDMDEDDDTIIDVDEDDDDMDEDDEKSAEEDRGEDAEGA